MVLVDEELGWNDVERLAHIRCDHGEGGSAILAGRARARAGAALLIKQIVPMNDARQMGGQGLTTRPEAGGFGVWSDDTRGRGGRGRRRRERIDFSGEGCTVRAHALVKQVPVEGIDGLALCAKAHAPQMRQLHHEGLDFELRGVELGGLASKRRAQPRISAPLKTLNRSTL